MFKISGSFIYMLRVSLSFLFLTKVEFNSCVAQAGIETIVENVGIIIS
jgi:hypothetical protein